MARYRITTPEQVSFHFEAAGLGTRFAAWFTDQLVLLLLKVLALFLLAQAGFLGFAIFLLFNFLLDFGYFLLLEHAWNGQTVGKRAFGLRVISTRSGRLRTHDVFLRNLLRPIDSLPIGMLVGGVAAFSDRYGRRLGDLAAETLVTRESRRALPAEIGAHRERANTFQEDPALRQRILARVNREERDLMLDLALRRDDLDPTVRRDLFAEAASRFRMRYDLPEDSEHLSDEQTVVNLALVTQQGGFAGVN